MGFVGFLKKYYGIIVIAAITITSFTIAGVTMYTSKKEYDEYLSEYEKNAEQVKASFPALPKSVFFDNDYVDYADDVSVGNSKSAYTNKLVLFARDAKVVPLSQAKKQEYKVLGDVDPEDAKYTINEYITGLDRMGGEITFTINTETYGMADIEVPIRTNWVNKAGEYQEIENLTDKISIQVNKLELKTTEVTLSDERDGFQSLILKDTFLIEGENTVTFSTSAYNDLDTKDNCLYIMPDIRNLTVISEAKLIVPERDTN